MQATLEDLQCFEEVIVVGLDDPFTEGTKIKYFSTFDINYN